MIEIFECLIGHEFDVCTLSIHLLEFNCEDILKFDNLEEILESGKMIVATNDKGFSIHISFIVTSETKGVNILDRTIYITDIVDL